MRLIALMPLRNESWICGLTIRAALMWCDSIVCGLHACTDDTETIVGQIWAENPDKVFPVILGDDRQWNEMDHRQKLLEECRRLGATHIALVDADEILVGDYLTEVRDDIERLGPSQIVQCTGYSMWSSENRVRYDGRFVNHCFSLAFKDHPALCWQDRDGYQHHHRHPFQSKPVQTQVLRNGTMHLQFVRQKAFAAKQAWYAMTELIRWPEQGVDKINRKYGWWNHGEVTLHRAPKSWWEPYQHLLQYADFTNRSDWHMQEIEKLIQEHGREKFAGLNLFGVV